MFYFSEQLILNNLVANEDMQKNIIELMTDIASMYGMDLIEQFKKSQVIGFLIQTLNQGVAQGQDREVRDRFIEAITPLGLGIAF